MLVAGRYAPRQQLIGPVFFPIYVFALKLGLGVGAARDRRRGRDRAALRGGSVPHFVDGMLAIPAGRSWSLPGRRSGSRWWTWPAARRKLKPDWDPRKIPDWMVGGRRPDRLPDRIHAVVEVIFGVLGLGWLLMVPTSPWLAMGPLSTVLAFAPVWRIWYVPLVLVGVANLALDAYGLFHPTRTARRVTLKLVHWVSARRRADDPVGAGVGRGRDSGTS